MRTVSSAHFDLGLLKPDPRIYESMREKLGCAFGEILFIDDKPANVEAAKALGINALVFNDGTAEKDVSRLMGWEREENEPASRFLNHYADV